MLPTKTNRNPTPDPNRKYETPNPRESRFAANAEEKSDEGNESSRMGAVREYGFYRHGLTDLGNWQGVTQNTSSTFSGMPIDVLSRVQEYLDPQASSEAMARFILDPGAKEVASNVVDSTIRHAQAKSLFYSTIREKKNPNRKRDVTKDAIIQMSKLVPLLDDRALATQVVNLMEQGMGGKNRPFLFRNRMSNVAQGTAVVDFGNGPEIIRGNEQSRFKRRRKSQNTAKKAIANAEDYRRFLKNYDIIIKGGKTFVRPKGG
jgi:hypothetical protein